MSKTCHGIELLMNTNRPRYSIYFYGRETYSSNFPQTHSNAFPAFNSKFVSLNELKNSFSIQYLMSSNLHIVDGFTRRPQGYGIYLRKLVIAYCNCEQTIMLQDAL